MNKFYLWANAILICGIFVFSNYIVENNLLQKEVWIDAFEFMWAVVGWCTYWFYNAIKHKKK